MLKLRHISQTQKRSYIPYLFLIADHGIWEQTLTPDAVLVCFAMTKYDLNYISAVYAVRSLHGQIQDNRGQFPT